MKILTRDQIRQADDMKTEFVACPEWAPEGTPGQERKEFGVFIKTPTAKEKDAFEARRYAANGDDEKANLENFRAEFVALCAVDSEGNRVFSPEDVAWLGDKSSAPVSRLFHQAMELSGTSKKDVEDMTKNSKDGQLEDSRSN